MATAWFLNLDAEEEMAAAGGYTPSKQSLDRTRELGAATGLVQEGDVLVTESTESLPRPMPGRAWCPTPRAVERLQAVGALVPPHPPLDVLRRVNARRFCFDLGGALEGARYVSELAELESIVRDGNGTGWWVVKRPFSFAGRGQRRIDGAVDDGTRGFCERALRQGLGLQIEPWVERQWDCVIHGEVDSAGHHRIGQLLMQQCSRWGIWERSHVPSAGQVSAADREHIERTAIETAAALHDAGYFGPFGIDGFRWRDVDGNSHLQARIEINARYCMGWTLGMAVSRAVAPVA